MYGLIVLKDLETGKYPSLVDRHKCITLTYSRKASIIHAVKRSKLVTGRDYKIYFYDTNESLQVLDVYYSKLADKNPVDKILAEVPTLDITN
jgi:hypothetical protein